MSSITDRMDINQVLMQMREMKGQAQALPAGPERLEGMGQPRELPGVSEGPAESSKTDFGDLLKQAVNSVNETQMQASELATAYELGDENVDLTQVMIQMQKANVSFEAMTQVRNRLVSAYQDIMNMPI